MSAIETNVGHNQGKFHGKFRALVVENIDPEFLGRILVDVPAIPAGITNWAMPCVPYAGFQVGFYAIPPIGANVWIEFEGGDPSYPIWVGCFWAKGEVPLEATAETKVFKTELNTLILDDLPEVGGVTLTSIPPAVDDICLMTFNAEGITITVPESVFNMTPVTVTTTTTDIVMTAEAAIEMEATADISATAGGAIELSATGDVTIDAVGAVEVTAGADVSLTAGGAAEVTGGADVTISAGGACEMSAGADCAITAAVACEMTAGADCAITAGLACEVTAGADCAITAVGACEVTAVAVAITGATEITGVLLIDGAPPMMLPI
ncbi:MAG: hypothetical protein HRT35_34660 [Algicola sp.]|nr:hypothetical protein [Algicola sp.]